MIVSDCGSRAAAFAVVVLLLVACQPPEKPRYEAAMANTLSRLRKAIATFHTENKRYPSSLEELVPKYLPQIPKDPITGTADWRLITEETVAVSSDFTTNVAPKPVVSILDVKSKAPGADASGKPYSEY